MTPLGLQASGTKVLRKGKPWRHIGVNFCHAFWRELYSFPTIANAGLDADLDYLKARNIDLTRIGFGWFSYQTWRDLYWLNKTAYWNAVRYVLNKHSERDMLTIANIGWNLLAFTQLSYYITGATIGPNKLSDPTNWLYTFARNYIREWNYEVGNHPAIAAQEFGNETSAKFGNEYGPSWPVDGSYSPACDMGFKPDGTRYAANDKMLVQDYQVTMRDFRAEFKAADPWNRMFLTGDAMGNAFGVSVRRTGNLTSDTLADWDTKRADLGGRKWLDHREEFGDGICMHTYPLATYVNPNPANWQFFGDGVLTYRQHIQKQKQWADEAGKPLILEECGSTRYGSNVDPISNPAVLVNPVAARGTVGSEATEKALDAECNQAIVDYDVPIVLKWNLGGDITYTAAEWPLWDLKDPTRTYQLDAIREINRARS